MVTLKIAMPALALVVSLGAAQADAVTFSDADTDGDRRLSHVELAQHFGPEAVDKLLTFDTNGDGVLNRREARASQGQQGHRGFGALRARVNKLLNGKFEANDFAGGESGPEMEAKQKAQEEAAAKQKKKEPTIISIGVFPIISTCNSLACSEP